MSQKKLAPNLASHIVARLALAMGATVLFVGAVSAGTVEYTCSNGSTKPDPVSPRADYCDAMTGLPLWAFLVAVPCLAVVGIIAAIKPPPRVAGLLALLACLVIAANLGFYATRDGYVPL